MIGYDAAKNAPYFGRVYQNAVELTAWLCKKYGLDPAKPGVVICHSEGHGLGVASNHADVMHWFPKHGKTMDDFRADVARAMAEEKEESALTQEQFDAMLAASRKAAAEAPASPWAREVWAKATAQSVFDGSQPRGALTREQAAMVLDRLGLLDGE